MLLVSNSTVAGPLSSLYRPVATGCCKKLMNIYDVEGLELLYCRVWFGVELGVDVFLVYFRPDGLESSYAKNGTVFFNSYQF